MRDCIPPYERLVATLRYLATGRSYEDLKFSTGISAQSLGFIIPETCQILYEELKDNYMRVRKYIYLIISNTNNKVFILIKV